MQGISRKIWENHLLFSHYLAWRRKCGRLPKFCAEIGSQRPVLAVHGLALTLQRKNQKGPHRKLTWEVRQMRMVMTQVRQTFTYSRYSKHEEQMYLIRQYSGLTKIEDDHHLKVWGMKQITKLQPHKAKGWPLPYSKAETYRCQQHKAFAINHQISLNKNVLEAHNQSSCREVR